MKFCSRCGGQLETSKRFCKKCGAANPYYFLSTNGSSAPAESLEKPKLGKERIELEMAEKEKLQEEFERKEKLRLELEEIERQKLERLEKVRQIKERFEREEIETAFKSEIQQVKDETEQYKKETNDTLSNLKGELQQIEEENRRLKEEFDALARGYTQEKVITVAPPVLTPPKPRKSFVARWLPGIVAFLLVALMVDLLYAMLLEMNVKKAKPASGVTQPQVKAKTNEGPGTVAVVPPARDSVVQNISVPVNPPPKPIAKKAAPGITIPVPNKPAHNPAPKENKPAFALSEGKVKSDLVGKNLAGCDVTISRASQINAISGLSLVETFPSGVLKYKFNVRVKIGADEFNATPYIYYYADGKFIKLDATNCE